MIYTEHKDAGSFLAVAREALERHEAANGLMLGICERMAKSPDACGEPVYLATVQSGGALRVASVMTPPHNVQVYWPAGEDTDALELVADGLLRGGWSVPGVIAQGATAEAFASVWCRRTGAFTRITMRQGIYELREVVQPTYPLGEFVQATPEHLAMVREWACGFHGECHDDDRREQSMRTGEGKLNSGDLFLWVHGKPRSMAARSRPTAHGQAVSLVYTPPEHRRKGYATAVVARLSQLILDGGKEFCTLYTDLANLTSNSIYRKIGYQQVGDSVDIRFEAVAVR
jgi:GNAT superfamily N-acetyltransferase